LLHLSEEEEERAQKLHRKYITFDSMGGLPSLYSDSMLKRLDELIVEKKPAWTIGNEMEELSIKELVGNPEYRKKCWETIKQAGVTGVSTTVGALSGPVPFTYENAVKDLAKWTYMFDALKDIFVKVVRAEDVRIAKKEGKFAVLLNFQNITHICNELDNLDFFYYAGIRQIQLTYNTRNFVGDGCTERTDAGLSNFGLEVVDRMNKLGILIDLSHCGHKTVMDAIKASDDPVVFTHINCHALCKHARCKTDEEIIAVAEKGGYIGLTIVPFFVSEKENPTFDDFLDHVHHVAELVGVDHLGIGTDDTGQADVPRQLLDLQTSLLSTIGFRPEHRARFGVSTRGFEHYVDWPNFTRGLVSRGYSDQEIQKILGENFLKVLEKVVG
jgi:membrane dipeptidase